MITRKEKQSVHHRAIVVDAHCDTIGRVLDERIDIRKRSKRGHMDIPRLKVGGVDVQFFACWISPSLIKEGRCIQRTLDMIDAFNGMVKETHGKISAARNWSDIRAVVGRGDIAGVLCVEGGHAINDDLGILRLYHELGVRYMTLTWMNNNGWADGSGDKPRHHGLTGFGRKVVREMERIGMMVDISHASEKTFWDVCKIASAPVIASHSCCKSICNHHRNLTDRQLRAVAKNGGVVCINFFSAFLSEPFRKEAKDLNNVGRIAPPPLDILIDHVVHAADVAGIDHVGLGSDYDGVGSVPEGVEDCSKLPAITERLFDRGMGAGDVAKILGGNLLRVIKAVC